MAFELPATGLRLAQLPKPADPNKKDKVPQSLVIDLSTDGLEKVLHAVQNLGGPDLSASFGTKDVIELLSSTSDGQPSKVEISGAAVEESLLLTENGFLYKTNEGAQASTLRSRIDLRQPQQSSLDKTDADKAEIDEGMLALTRGISNAKAQKQSHRTTLAELNLSSRQQKGAKFGGSLVAQLTGGKGRDLKAHRHGMFDRGKQASLNHSPHRFGLDLDVQPHKDRRKVAMDEARKKALIHLLAVRPAEKAQIARSLRCALVDIERLLERFTRKSKDDPAKLELTERAYKSLDPYGFNYPEEDRKLAIDRAVEAFDRIRLSKGDKEWQMLLPKEERGKDKCLSKLANIINGDEPRPAPIKNNDARNTPIPLEINVSDVGSPPPPSDDEMSRKRASDKAADDSGDRPAKRTKQTTTNAFEKRLFSTPAQREKAKQKEREKQEKEALAAKRREAAKTTTQASPKAAPKKASESKMAPKSKEFVSLSDDEEADAHVRKAQAVQKAKSESKPESRPEPKTTAPTVVKAPAKASVKAPAKTSAKAVSAMSPAMKALKNSATNNADRKKAATAAAAEKEKASKPDPWDFASQRTPNPQSRPPAVKPVAPRANVNLHHRKKLDVTQTSAKNMVTSPLHRPASTGSSTTKAAAARPSEKTATQRSELARKQLDPARRSAGSDSAGAKPSGLKPTPNSARPDRPRNISSRLERPAASPAGRTTAPATPARGHETGKPHVMQRTFSHQRKSSSPLKPSPLAASPPLNFSDIDKAARGDKPAEAPKPAPKRALPPTEARVAPKPLKRKADEVETKQSKNTTSSAASHAERPAKRRETGTAASLSAGATASKPAATRHSDTSMLKARRQSQEGQKSHSPSPASSTIGSTSTKGTSMSLLTNNGGKERSNSDVSNGNMARNVSRNGEKKADALDGDKSTLAKPNKAQFKGIERAELLRMMEFEDQRDEYNRKQKEVAAMENPPIEKVRELNKMFHSLETQKKVLSRI